MAQQLAKNVSFHNNTSWTSLLDMIYPKGSYYFSNASTNPASLFGGGWTAITGRFPYMNAGTSTGGSNTHTLTVAQMPRHTHEPQVLYANAPAQNAGAQMAEWNYGHSNVNLLTVGYTGGGQAHNNMPAYKEIYAWYRTS